MSQPAGGGRQAAMGPGMQRQFDTYGPRMQATMAKAPSGNVMQTSANLYNQAAAGPNIGQFMNPYTQQVVNASMQDLERQRLMQQRQMGAQATAAGAFGGSRQGVAEAETNRAFADQGAQMAAGLRSQGFNTALQAAQAQQGIQSGLAGQGFGFGQAITNQQMQQGAQQQQMLQALIDASRGQFQGAANAPAQSLQQLMGGIAGGNLGQQSTTQTYNPGALGYLQAFGSLFG
jgi:hypothetical protein